MNNIIVITPTTGSSELVQAIKSVQAQTLNVDHLIVVDGIEHSDKFNSLLSLNNLDNKNISKLYLPFNTGGNGFYGHRIMAAVGHLINHEYVLFLDQDNWFDNNHVETLVELIKTKNCGWVHSLRKITDKEGNFICNDNCESLGKYPAWTSDNVFHVDTSSYCFKTSFFRRVCHVWDYGWGADRRFFNAVKQHAPFSCTHQYTLNYRLDGNPGSVTKDFFIKGNQVMFDKYKGFPWQRK